MQVLPHSPRVQWAKVRRQKYLLCNRSAGRHGTFHLTHKQSIQPIKPIQPERRFVTPRGMCCGSAHWRLRTAQPTSLLYHRLVNPNIYLQYNALYSLRTVVYARCR
jgi:hypothetical protein